MFNTHYLGIRRSVNQSQQHRKYMTRFIGSCTLQYPFIYLHAVFILQARELANGGGIDRTPPFRAKIFLAALRNIMANNIRVHATIMNICAKNPAILMGNAELVKLVKLIQSFYISFPAKF